MNRHKVYAMVLLTLLFGALLFTLQGCVGEAPAEVEVESEEAPLIVLGCSQNNLRLSALDTIVDIFWGYRSECRSIRLGGGVIGYECGQSEAYIYDRDLGYDKAIDRFYTRVIPMGPTKSTSVVMQFDQCGDGRAGDEGQGARTPLDSGCWQAGKVICKCGRPCAIEWY